MEKPKARKCEICGKQTGSITPFNKKVTGFDYAHEKCLRRIRQDAKQQEEIATAARYLRAAEDEYNAYHTKNNLIGRALLDMLQRARLIHEDALKGIPFGKIKR